LAFTIPEFPPFVDAVTGTDGPTDPLPGGELLTALTYPEYFQLQDGDELHTVQVDFALLWVADSDVWQFLIDTMRSMFASNSLELLAAAVWVAPVEPITLPTQVCFLDQCADLPQMACVPFTDVCVNVAGAEITFAYQVRVWLEFRELPLPGPVLPFIIPLWLILTILGVVIPLAGMLIVGWMQAQSGQRTVGTAPLPTTTPTLPSPSGTPKPGSAVPAPGTAPRTAPIQPSAPQSQPPFNVTPCQPPLVRDASGACVQPPASQQPVDLGMVAGLGVVAVGAVLLLTAVTRGGS